MTTLPKAFSPEVLNEMLSEAAKAELQKPVRPFDPRNAEIVGSTVRWYVVSVFSRDAEAELAKRRFGIFVPAVEETIVRRGRQVTRHVPLVAGYVFVLMWECDENWLRVANTAGVDKIIGWVTDEEIDKLRFHEGCEQLDANARRKVAVRVIQGARKRPRPSRRVRKSRKLGKARQPA